MNTRLEYRKIKTTNPLAKRCADIIHEHSWGLEYPVNAWDELKESEYIIGCFEGEKLAGFGAITRVASPDEIDNGLPWLADAVVLPEYREQGIYREFYEKRMEYLRKRGEKIVLVCTDNPLIEKFLGKRGWKIRRETRDESGGFCKIFENNLKGIDD